MRSTIAGPILASLIAVAVGACGSDGGGGSESGSGPGPTAYCTQYSTCDTCTPANGCGWCYDSDGTGMCASGPDQCATQAFSWTWDIQGCRVAADASVVPEPLVSAAPSTDAGPVSPPDGSAPVDASGDSAYSDAPPALGLVTP
jgi:hypothetical protein